MDLYFWRGKSIKENGDLDFAKKDFNRVIKTDSKLVGQAYYEGSLIYKYQTTQGCIWIVQESTMSAK